MPTLPDLEINDFDLKPYMDPTILLDTFSADDMDIWQNYNLFVDDNINSSLKEQIKEENTDLMDCCFSSICPNDLINNVENNLDKPNIESTLDFNQQLNQQQPIYASNINYDQQSSTNEYYSTNSSSCSSSPSIESTNQYFETKPAMQLNLDSLTFTQQQQCIVNNNENANNFQTIYESNFPVINDNKIEYFQISNSENEPSLSPSSSVSSSSLSTSSASSTTGDNNFSTEKTFDRQKSSKKIQKLSELSTNPQSIIIVEAPQNNNKNTESLTISTSQKLSKKSANILPPSPPSSFGSDSESNQSTTSSTNHITSSKLVGLKSNKLLKSSKLNNQLRNNATIIKQMRHQPYSFKQAKNANKSKVVIKAETSILDTSNSLLNLSTNSDDDCWPFLCSLSKLPSSGPIMLTEEEKRTLIQEGHQVPSQLPLTKSEEKILKKIRRKIKNKISAQESRRKKKEYVDSLEKRMESYINENVDLKKRLEKLEFNNKNLLQQLQKMQSSLGSTDSEFELEAIESNSLLINNSTNNALNINSANQFGTLLMVLVLFFTVLLGVWSPLITKDQITQASATAATAAAASINVRSTRSPVNSISYSATSATTTAAVAVASLAIASSVSTVKTESLSPAPSESNNEEICMDESIQISNFNTRPVIMNDDEDDFLANDAILTGQINNNNLMVRSKTGTAVELTKVRPFIRKLPTIQSNMQSGQVNQANQQQNSSFITTTELPTVNSQQQEEAQQIIILNLAPSQTNSKISEIVPNIPESLSVKSAANAGGISIQNSSTASNIPVNIINSSNSQKPLNAQSNFISLNGINNSTGYRVINTIQNANAQKLTACTTNSAKLPTKFRLVNTGINAFNNHHLAPSVIKLNSLA